MIRPTDDSRSAPRARFVTFGCKVNQYDTQLLREAAESGGYRCSGEDTATGADVIVVNTCTVTEHGGAEARKAVRRLARAHPEAEIIVTGCYAVSDPDEVAALPNVRRVVPNDGKGDLLAELAGREKPGPAKPFIENTITDFRDHTRAFLKVQDGCYLRCTYCIIPRVRPEVTSKDPATVVSEVRDLVAAGFHEVVVTGVHVGAYGRTGPGAGPRDALSALLARILDETDLPRLRLSSVESFEATKELLDLFAAEPRLARHLHIPLQSGSKAVLNRMRRRYTPKGFLATVAAARERLPNCAISTDVIVGFPGETDEDFALTLAVLREARIMKTHVFPFSPRRNTPAAAMRDGVHSAEIRRRVTEATEVGNALAEEYAAGFTGRDSTVLVETRRLGGRLTGFTGRYLRAWLDGPDEWMGTMKQVKISGPNGTGVEAMV